MNSLEIGQETVKKMLQCERDYRCEVSDPKLRLEKLRAFWKHDRFMTERAQPHELASIIRELLDYQINQVNNLIFIATRTNHGHGGVSDQHLKVLNATFEYICRLARSAQANVMQSEDLDGCTSERENNASKE